MWRRVDTMTYRAGFHSCFSRFVLICLIMLCLSQDDHIHAGVASTTKNTNDIARGLRSCSSDPPTAIPKCITVLGSSVFEDPSVPKFGRRGGKAVQRPNAEFLEVVRNAR